MSNRLTKIYTRSGDRGSTGIGGGVRVEKDDPRIEAIGSVDELNSSVGLVLAEELSEESRSILTEIQHDLFDVGVGVYRPEPLIDVARRVAWLEETLDRLNEALGPLEEFILPGGCRAAAACHLARTVCRRAERRVAALKRAGHSDNDAGKYLNRLSDLLFVLARHLNREAGTPDVLWRPAR
ncbi:cob(I)yrinic acid a,c-diamide adenosyltransferase [Endothiovibrio diazotrophicus]